VNLFAYYFSVLKANSYSEGYRYAWEKYLKIHQTLGAFAWERNGRSKCVTI